MMARLRSLLRRFGTSKPLETSAAGVAEATPYEPWAKAHREGLTVIGGEAERIRLRRANLADQGVPADAQVSGLAISGGGIRSATFGLGVMRELAALHLLHRFDYLSTVSGGSYVGSYYCGLFARRGGADPILTARDFPDPFTPRTGLGRASLDWLRQSGRYLAPTGAGDYWNAVGLLVRNWIGLHLVIGTTMMLVALIAVGARIAAYRYHGPLDQGPSQDWIAGFITFSPMLALLVVPVGIHIAFSWAYWLTKRDVHGSPAPVTAAQAGTAIIFATGMACCFVPRQLADVPDAVRPIALGIGAFAAAGLMLLLLSMWREPSGIDDEARWDARRKFLTAPMDFCAKGFVAVLAIAAADKLGFVFYNGLYDRTVTTLVASPVIVGVVVPAGRWLLARLLPLTGSIKTPAATKPGEPPAAPPFFTRELFLKIGAALAGGLLLLAVVGFWTVLAYRAAWPLMPSDPTTICRCAKPPAGPAGCHIAKPLPGRSPKTTSSTTVTTTPTTMSVTTSASTSTSVAPKPAGAAIPCRLPWDGRHQPPRGEGAMFLPWLSWSIVLLFLSICIGFTPAFLNLSGLSGFYAGRLRRAYLGAGNRQRLEPSTDKDRALDKWSMHDDVPLVGASEDQSEIYFEKGTPAPLHLINITLNETRGTGSNIVQRDRHGRNFVVSPEGLYYDADRAGMLKLIRFGETDHEQLPLSTWIAISGAAFSTGLGAQTGFPVTQLAGLANVRLGYWWRATGQYAGKPTQWNLLREFRGDFSGPDEKYWYLSDGGHFENTGAYELIRRKVPFIVVCDNGMDTRFEYEDLAGLVRKARIDFDCEINFLDVAALDAVFGADNPARASFGTLVQIAGAPPPVPSAPRAVAALAQTTFDDGTAGTLLLIKPRLTGDGPADLVRYKASNAAFPQQTTIDQFFDEAQWESYYTLGRLIAQAVFGTPRTNPGKHERHGWSPADFRAAPAAPGGS